jgi:hypothetical protein
MEPKEKKIRITTTNNSSNNVDYRNIPDANAYIAVDGRVYATMDDGGLFMLPDDYNYNDITFDIPIDTHTQSSLQVPPPPAPSSSSSPSSSSTSAAILPQTTSTPPISAADQVKAAQAQARAAATSLANGDDINIIRERHDLVPKRSVRGSSVIVGKRKR